MYHFLLLISFFLQMRSNLETLIRWFWGFPFSVSSVGGSITPWNRPLRRSCHPNQLCTRIATLHCQTNARLFLWRGVTARVRSTDTACVTIRIDSASRHGVTKDIISTETCTGVSRETEAARTCATGLEAVWTGLIRWALGGRRGKGAGCRWCGIWAWGWEHSGDCRCRISVEARGKWRRGDHCCRRIGIGARARYRRGERRYWCESVGCCGLVSISWILSEHKGI